MFKRISAIFDLTPHAHTIIDSNGSCSYISRMKEGSDNPCTYKGFDSP